MTDDKKPAPTWIEWTARIVSAALVLALTAFVTYHAIVSNEPASISLEVDAESARRVDDGWATPVHAINEGDEGVTDVVFEIQQEGAEPQTFLVPLLGPGVTHDLMVIVPAPPTSTPVRGSVLSYQ